MYLTEQMVGMNPPPQVLQQQQPILRQWSQQHVLPGKACGPEPQRREGKARGEVSRSSLEDSDRGAQCSMQGGSDGQMLQPAFLECGLSGGSGPPIGLRLRKSASLVDFFNKSLADQGRQSQEQSQSSNACDGSTWTLDPAVLDGHQQTDTSTDRSTLHQGALQGASVSGSISSGSAGAAWNYVPSTDAQCAGAPVAPQHQQLAACQPLPASQSQIDLESFAASILLDDMQPMSGEDLSGSWRRGDEAPRGSECSINDHVMHGAQHDSCADTAWMCEGGFVPALRELASAPPAAAALLNPFEGLPELECAAAAAAMAPAGLYSSAARSLVRTASVPPGPHLVDPFFVSSAMAPCLAGPHLSRTVSMPAAAAAVASPRKRRNVADLLKAGPGGVTKSSPRSMMRAASALARAHLTPSLVALVPLLCLAADIPCPELMAQPRIRAVL